MTLALTSVISLAYLRTLEGRQVNLVLVDGTWLEACNLVSVGRLWARSVWLLKNDTDVIINPDQIAEICVLDHPEAA
jgi:hypothetical protein